MKSVPLDCNRKPLRYIHVEQFTKPLFIFPGSLALRLKVEEYGWLHFLYISLSDLEPSCRKKLLPTRIRDKTMKKLVILLMLATTFVAFSQYEVDFNNLPDIKNAVTLNENVFSNPVDLSKYCSKKAQQNITNAKKCLITSIALEGVGGGLMGLAMIEEKEKGFVLGLLTAATGAVFGIISVVDFVSHFQWEYRRKQVDLYLSPNGVTLKF